MKEWQKEMIAIIKKNDFDPNETVAMLMNGVYSGDQIYIDHLATAFTTLNLIEAEELKDCLDNEIIERG